MYFVLILVIARYAILSMLIAIIFDQVERDSILVIKQAAQTAMVAVFKFERRMLHGLLRFFFLSSGLLRVEAPSTMRSKKTRRVGLV